MYKRSNGTQEQTCNYADKRYQLQKIMKELAEKRIVDRSMILHKVTHCGILSSAFHKFIDLGIR